MRPTRATPQELSTPPPLPLHLPASLFHQPPPQLLHSCCDRGSLPETDWDGPSLPTPGPHRGGAPASQFRDRASWARLG